ncbi:hypothetical protein NG831_10540 [Xanthomonas sacchari]|uniref:Spore coat protein U domain-containing protein n=1 Tax=Xanthomonas sacchari TaxID=56458 RepID=A0ABT3DUL8_9XANT|nr:MULTISPECIES: hypothetical protein [Xanthomonas]MCW0372975.1 hypothetical protein [Xanthomonas sacchari]MCW0380822.1 hypothetical protein [Xanthomonas sacchari]MCW0399195.1 hypothetical protein [Xanthomonas sacchari]MCW0411596.1 hypothetical protein [Xanthomonas sacchari]MCW0420431.1 hypothetical protein [Xanthomonas sacchari]
MSQRQIAIALFLIFGPAQVALGSDATQDISISIADNDDSTPRSAQCTASNKFGTKQLVVPGTITVHTSDDDLVIACTSNGYSARETYGAKMTGKACTSILHCGGFGFVINSRTGAGYSYPAKIEIMLRADSSIQ